MTDNEIIKALKCCNKPIRENSCTECAFYHSGRCSHNMLKATLDLINRQKAAIERLNAKIAERDKTNFYTMGQLRLAREKLATAKSETIKEFVQKLKEESFRLLDGSGLVVVDMVNVELLAEKCKELCKE